MSLVNKDIELIVMSINDGRHGISSTDLILVLELDHTGQVDQSTFHTVETLDDDQNLLPWTMRLRLSLTDNFPQQRLEVVHIVVLEHANISPAQPNTEPDRSVVEFVRDDQAAFVDQRGDDCRVGRKTHRADKRILLPDELGDQCLRNSVQLGRAAFETRPACGHTVPLQPLLNRVCTSATGLSEPEVVVRGDVQSARAGAGEREIQVIIVRFTIEKVDGASRHARGRVGETVVKASLEPAGIERVEI